MSHVPSTARWTYRYFIGRSVNSSPVSVLHRETYSDNWNLGRGPRVPLNKIFRAAIGRGVSVFFTGYKVPFEPGKLRCSLHAARPSASFSNCFTPFHRFSFSTCRSASNSAGHFAWIIDKNVLITVARSAEFRRKGNRGKGRGEGKGRKRNSGYFYSWLNEQPARVALNTIWTFIDSVG